MGKTTEPQPTHRVLKAFRSDVPHRPGDLVDASSWRNTLGLERTGYIAPIADYDMIVADRQRAARTITERRAESPIKELLPGELAAYLAARDAQAATRGTEPNARTDRELARGER